MAPRLAAAIVGPVEARDYDENRQVLDGMMETLELFEPDDICGPEGDRFACGQIIVGLPLPGVALDLPIPAPGHPETQMPHDCHLFRMHLGERVGLTGRCCKAGPEHLYLGIRGGQLLLKLSMPSAPSGLVD